MLRFDVVLHLPATPGRMYRKLETDFSNFRHGLAVGLTFGTLNLKTSNARIAAENADVQAGTLVPYVPSLKLIRSSAIIAPSVSMSHAGGGSASSRATELLLKTSSGAINASIALSALPGASSFAIQSLTSNAPNTLLFRAHSPSVPLTRTLKTTDARARAALQPGPRGRFLLLSSVIRALLGVRGMHTRPEQPILLLELGDAALHGGVLRLALVPGVLGSGAVVVSARLLAFVGAPPSRLKAQHSLTQDLPAKEKMDAPPYHSQASFALPAGAEGSACSRAARSRTAPCALSPPYPTQRPATDTDTATVDVRVGYWTPTSAGSRGTPPGQMPTSTMHRNTAWASSRRTTDVRGVRCAGATCCASNVVLRFPAAPGCVYRKLETYL
ncbi:hypothetical protein DFH11DRAFT_1735940 [Phellopilus nigrolimitatus]|nr:hypothetical protein DFH11DRAFT_1735940 [Phellopilus nigrolimitatus]